MSWAFTGSATPTLPIVVTIADVGPGTSRCLVWNRTNGSGADDQIVRFQWGCKEVKAEINGTASLRFYNQGFPSIFEDHNVAFSSTVITTDPATDASDRVPSDIVTGDTTSFGVSDAQTIPVTTAWGTEQMEYVLDLQIGVGNLGVTTGTFNGTYFTDYSKVISLNLYCRQQDPSSSGFASGITLSLIDNGNPLGSNIDPFFHDLAPLYQTTQNIVGSTFVPSISLTFSCIRTAEFPSI